jgi:hypothetical protein
MRLSAKITSILLLLGALPAAAFEPARIDLVINDEGQAYFSVAGTWPDTCPPRLTGFVVEDHDVTLLGARETVGCQPSPTPYSLASAQMPLGDLLPDEGVHRVRLQLEEAPGGRLPLAGFALVTVGPMPAGLALETGFWWAEQGGEFAAGPGLGLSVETQSGLISLSVMGYDAQGASAWYFGAGEIDTGTAHLELGQFEGGAGPFAHYSAPETIQLSGVVDVEPITPSRAVLWFSRPDPETGLIDLRPLSIVRFSFAQDPGEALLGRWVLTSADPGQRATRWLDFVRSEPVENGFILHDASGAVLQCEASPGLPGSPPALCRLDAGDGDAVEFTDIALRRLAGWDSGTHRTLAFRLD